MKLWVPLLLFSTFALAHDAPSGWTYDSSCCSGTDCGQVEVEDVGTLIRYDAKTNEYIVTNNPSPGWYSEQVFVDPTYKGDLKTPAHYRNLKQWMWSKDRFFHICRPADGTVTFCLYVPPMGM